VHHQKLFEKKDKTNSIKFDRMFYVFHKYICNIYTYIIIFIQCPIEWFHYGCVGLTQAPKGKWYCPQCTAAMKRRGRK
jgi:hypothetical protein